MIQIQGHVGPAPSRVATIEITLSGDELIALQNILTHASQTYTHGRTSGSKAYAEVLRERSHHWLVMIEGQQEDIQGRIERLRAAGVKA